MKTVDLEIHDISLTGSSSGAYTMVLGVVNDIARIPVVIGGFEAQSIAIALEKKLKLLGLLLMNYLRVLLTSLILV